MTVRRVCNSSTWKRRIGCFVVCLLFFHLKNAKDLLSSLKISTKNNPYVPLMPGELKREIWSTRAVNRDCHTRDARKCSKNSVEDGEIRLWGGGPFDLWTAASPKLWFELYLKMTNKLELRDGTVSWFLHVCDNYIGHHSHEYTTVNKADSSIIIYNAFWRSRAAYWCF